MVTCAVQYNTVMKKLFLLGLLAQTLSLTALADVRLPAIIGDHMVLQ